MNNPIKIGIIGDFDPDRPSHTSTNDALNHTAQALGASLEIVWLSTDSMEDPSAETALRACDACLCAPGSPYRSPGGALTAIRFCREHGWPFIGT